MGNEPSATAPHTNHMTTNKTHSINPNTQTQKPKTSKKNKEKAQNRNQRTTGKEQPQKHLGKYQRERGTRT